MVLNVPGVAVAFAERGEGGQPVGDGVEGGNRMRLLVGRRDEVLGTAVAVGLAGKPRGRSICLRSVAWPKRDRRDTGCRRQIRVDVNLRTVWG